MLAGLVCCRAKDFMLTAVRTIRIHDKIYGRLGKLQKLFQQVGHVKRHWDYMETEQAMGCLLLYWKICPTFFWCGRLFVFVSLIFFGPIFAAIAIRDHCIEKIVWCQVCPGLGVCTFDGDTPKDDRARLLKSCGLVCSKKKLTVLRLRPQWLGFSGSKS